MANLIKPNAMTKWDRMKDALKEGLTTKQGRFLDSALDNTRNEFMNRQKLIMENASGSGVSTGNIATLQRVVLPILRRVMPNVIANEIVGIQPMQAPVGQVVTMRYTYGNTNAGSGVVSGNEALAPAHVRDIAVAYSGNENQLYPGAAPVGMLEGVPGNTMKLEILKQTVTAQTRRLSARWTV